MNLALVSVRALGLHDREDWMVWIAADVPLDTPITDTPIIDALYCISKWDIISLED